MTLLNHVGVFVVILLVFFILALLSRDTRVKYLKTKDSIYLPLSSGFIWLIFEAFYWTFKIFFL